MSAVIWFVTPCSSGESPTHGKKNVVVLPVLGFKKERSKEPAQGGCKLRLSCEVYSSTLKMEAIYSFEASESFRTTQLDNQITALFMLPP
jgi:hypothetical protein